jgi:NADPH-dependent glutamate synthase beta subunit-like oxidoreductase
VPAIHPPAARVQRGVVAAFDARLGFGEVTVTSGYKKRKMEHIVGAGIAGMECAMLLGRRGYKVHLYDKRSILGGLIEECK